MNNVAVGPTQVLTDSLIEQLELSPRTVERLRRLESYDLSSITGNFLDKGPQYSPEQVWPIRLHFGRADREIAEMLEREFRRFVALTVMRPGHIYAPSGPVDMYWHFFVLHTREYERFCTAIWGSPDGRHGDSLNVPKSSAVSAAAVGAADLELRQITIVPESVVKSLPDDTIRRLKALESYDLSYFTEHLVDRGRMFTPEQQYPIKAHFGKCDIEVTLQLEHEFRRFVALTLIDPEVIFAPSGPVDMYWHFLILHSNEYREFCDTIWGAFQHHPRGSRSGETADALT